MKQIENASIVFYCKVRTLCVLNLEHQCSDCRMSAFWCQNAWTCSAGVHSWTPGRVLAMKQIENTYRSSVAVMRTPSVLNRLMYRYQYLPGRYVLPKRCIQSRLYMVDYWNDWVIPQLTDNRLGWTTRCGQPPLLLPSCKKLEFKTVSVWWTRIWHG